MEAEAASVVGGGHRAAWRRGGTGSGRARRLRSPAAAGRKDEDGGRGRLAGEEAAEGVGPRGPNAAGGGEVVSAAAANHDVTRGGGGPSGHVCLARFRPAAAGEMDLGFAEGPMDFGGGLYIGIGGARKVQMRYGFRPRDRDRTL